MRQIVRPKASPRWALAVLLAASLCACGHPNTQLALVPSSLADTGVTTVDSAFSVNEVDTPARFIDFRKPVYPPELQQAGVCGTADLVFVVAVSGLAESASLTVKRASRPEFGAAARDAVAGSVFSPAVRAGKKVRQRFVQRVTFAIGGSASGPRSGPCH